MESEDVAKIGDGVCIKRDSRRIIQEESELAGIDPGLVLSGDRRKAVIHVKQRVCLRLRNDYRYTLPMIGRELGMDHTSILYLLRRRVDEAPPPLNPKRVPRIVCAYRVAENLRKASRTSRRLVELLNGMPQTVFSKQGVAKALRISERYAEETLCASFARGEIHRVRRGYYQAIPKPPVVIPFPSPVPAVRESAFITPVTKAQLMGRRA